MGKISAQTPETEPNGNEELVFAKSGANGKMTLENANQSRFITFIAGENLVDNDLCYLDTDGRMYKTDATIEAKTRGLLSFAIGTITLGASGKFQRSGPKTMSGLVISSRYYVGTTPGAISITPPTIGQFLREIGTAILTTKLDININESYYQVS